MQCHAMDGAALTVMSRKRQLTNTDTRVRGAQINANDGALDAFGLVRRYGRQS